MPLPRTVVWVFLLAVMILAAHVAPAQEYPNKPIRIITAAAGGGSDFVARQIAQGISGPLGQPVIVENRASGMLSAEAVSKAPPDGYTLFIGGASLWITPLLQKTSYDVARDFLPISLIAREVNVLVVHPSLPVKSVKELIALAQARPGELNYSSAATGGLTHLGMELFKHMAGVNIVRVPYKGNAPAITGLLSGEVQLTMVDAGLVTPHIKTRRLRGLAVTSAEPSALAPGLPTIAASGMPGYESIGMTVILAPGKTPGAIINRLNQEIGRVLNLPEVKERLLSVGEEIIASSPEQFAAIIKSDTARTAKVIKDAGIKVD